MLLTVLSGHPASLKEFFFHCLDSIISYYMKVSIYCKVPKFLDTRKLCCKKPKIQEKRPNLWVFRQKDANGIANSVDPDQTDLGLH